MSYLGHRREPPWASTKGIWIVIVLFLLIFFSLNQTGPVLPSLARWTHLWPTFFFFSSSSFLISALTSPLPYCTPFFLFILSFFFFLRTIFILCLAFFFILCIIFTFMPRIFFISFIYFQQFFFCSMQLNVNDTLGNK